MKKLHDLYQAKDFPVFQNRMFDSSEEARNCQKGNITLAQDPETGLILIENSALSYSCTMRTIRMSKPSVIDSNHT